MIVAVLCQVTNLIISFVARTVFIKTLGAEYLGISGLFGNVLMVLSFAELGIGNALLFSMYKPIAEKDEPKQRSLLLLYKKAYNYISLIVLVCGLLVMPFIKYMIKEEPSIPENIYLLYFLFLLNTVLSYVYVYKKSIIIAHQQNWIALLTKQGGHILMTILQIIVLVYTHNYILFLILQLTFTFLENVFCSLIADKKYPYILDKAELIPSEERKGIFQNVKSMAFYKFGSVILNGTDSILISMLVNLTTVGIVSNYVLIYGACNSILANITSSFTASVGNLNATSEADHKYRVFQRIFFITAWIYGFTAVALVFLTKPFITQWVGDEYVLGMFAVIGIVSEFYIQGIHTAECTYRITTGLFVKGRLAPLFGSILNIVLSFVFFNWIGLAGIFFATSIARILTIGIVDTILIYKYVFKRNPIRYYLVNVLYLLLFVIFGVCADYVQRLIMIDGWLGVVLKCVAFTAIFNILFLSCFWKTRVFKEIIQSVRSILHR